MLQIPKNLISKYAVSVPRYTSYPTAVEFTAEFDTRAWKETLEVAGKDSPLSLYVHIPFCPKLCYFCACNKIITTDQSVTKSYLKALFKELETLARYFGDAPVRQIHWGGGSPNFLRPEEMVSLQEETIRRFPRMQSEAEIGAKNDAEISVELDPRTTTLEQLHALKESGFNRVSFGVQDFNQNVQETINRVQTFEQTKELSDQSRQLGFSGVNLDLIYGLPNQTLEGFEETVRLVNILRPDRIALYGYAHVTWLQKVQKSFERAHLPTPEERIELFQLAVKSLSQAGYHHIGLDHFALPDDELTKSLRSKTLHRNFMGYTTEKGTSLLGFGASAISTLNEAFSQNEKDPKSYESRIYSDGVATVRGYRRSAEDLWRGELIEEVLCSGVVNIGDFAPHANLEDFRSQLEEFAADQLIEFTPNGFQLTEVGRFFSRNIASVFDAYLAKHSMKKTFSQAV